MNNNALGITFRLSKMYEHDDRRQKTKQNDEKTRSQPLLLTGTETEAIPNLAHNTSAGTYILNTLFRKTALYFIFDLLRVSSVVGGSVSGVSYELRTTYLRFVI